MAATVVCNAFVYGSLLAPEVLTALLHRIPRSSLAVVNDYHRYSIKDRIYPAVLPKIGGKVFGKVLFDLSDQELHILDEFEDIEYNKLIVSPLILKAQDVEGKLVDSASQEMKGVGCLERVGNALTLTIDQPNNVNLGNNINEGFSIEMEVTAYMYVWTKQGDPDLFGNWDYEEWVKTHLEDYVKMCEEFESELSKAWDVEGNGE